MVQGIANIEVLQWNHMLKIEAHWMQYLDNFLKHEKRLQKKIWQINAKIILCVTSTFTYLKQSYNKR